MENEQDESGRITLDENWWIESDTASWNLYYRKEGDINPNTGNPVVSRDASFHATLEQAMLWYLDRSCKGSLSLSEVLSRLEKAEANIIAAIRGMEKK